jgi:hypothetical protein
MFRPGIFWYPNLHYRKASSVTICRSGLRINSAIESNSMNANHILSKGFPDFIVFLDAGGKEGKHLLFNPSSPAE